MLRLEDFVEDYITEAGRGRPRKNKEETGEMPEIKDVDPETVKISKKAKDIANKVKPGVDAEDNGTHGSWDVDSPTDDDNLSEYDDESLELSINTIELLDRFTTANRSRGGKLSDKDNHGDFFIQGEAGWGKTSVITKMAKQFGRHVITVYLDKAMKEDLGGIPVPREGVKQNSKEAQSAAAYADTAMPSWAYYMLMRPNDKFLLFFDEMNQADPGVMNALMPIVLEKKICGYKFKNFMVGAAGNFKHENGAVEELSGPLLSRFKPIIIWAADNDQWNESLRYLRKEWESVLGKETFDAIENLGFIFENPRELEHKLLQWLEGHKENPMAAMRKKLGSPDRILKRIDELVSEKRMNEISDKGRKEIELAMQQTAELLSDWVLGKEKKEDEEDSRGRGTKDMVPDKLKQAIRNAMSNGYLQDNANNKYGISRENITEFFTDPDVYSDYMETNDPLNAEMIDRLISKFEEDGIKFKFEKNDEWKKLKYEDPLAE